MVLLIVGTADAQRRHGYRRQRVSDDYYRPRVGLTGGLNIANTISSRNSDFSTNTKLGANVGLFVDVPIVYPLSREGLAAAAQAFAAAAGPDGRVRERIDLIFLTAWSPDASQPQPARRGSGRSSLTQALRPPA